MENAQLSKAVNQKLEALIASARHIVDTTVEDRSLWGDRTHTLARCAIVFFELDILNRKLSANSIRVIEKHIPTLPTDPIEALDIVNAPHHDVRNYLIRNEIDLT